MIEALGSGWLIAISVAVVPAFVGVIGGLIGREARTPREIRNLEHLSESLAKVPLATDAHTALSRLLADYADNIRPKLLESKKLNKINVVLTVVLVIITLFVMYLLVNWIAASVGGWNVFAITVTVIFGLFLFLINAASVTTWYNPSTPSKTKS